jgi:hypothetical protein
MMPTVLLDGNEFSADTTPATWAELLDLVDRHVRANGCIVTGTRFDGVDEPAFRERGALTRGLDDLATVEISSGTPESLLGQCVAEAASSIGPLCAAALETGERFRTRELELANQGLLQLAEGVSTLTAIGGAVIIASRGDVEAERRHASLNAGVVEMTDHVEGLMAAQKKRDWARVADILQRDVEPALRRWETLLSDLTVPSSSTSTRPSID